MTGAMPLRHISIRVPWHDHGWDGTVCRKPCENSSCLALPRIRESRDDARELAAAGKRLVDLAPEARPPCVAERVSFMSPEAFSRTVEHPYRGMSSYHAHLRPTPLVLPAYSAAVVPFRWMLKESAQELAEFHGLDYDASREPGEPEWLKDTSWVQEGANQRSMLEAFRAGIRVEKSLCVFCVKQAPLTEEGSRIIVGMGRVLAMNAPQLYEREDGEGNPTYLWEMPLQHSIRPDFMDGFLLPYHSLLKKAAADTSINTADYVAEAPADRLLEFSHACEHVTHDGIIASLLACKAALQKAARIVDEPCDRALQWIDHRLSELWRLRGPFPGLGAALSAFQVKHGNFVAHALAERVGENQDPWPLVDQMFRDSAKVLPPELRGEITPNLCKKWLSLSKGNPERIALLKLLARMELTNAQALRLYDPDIRAKCGITYEDSAFLADPYRVYEADRFSNYDPEKKFPEPISLPTVERAVFPPVEVRKAHPLPAPAALKGDDDSRRIRAHTVHALETAAAAGDSLLPVDRLLEHFRRPLIDPPCPVDRDTLAAIADELAPLAVAAALKDGTPGFKLDRLVRCRDVIRKTVEKRTKKAQPLTVAADWAKLLDKRFGPIAGGDSDEARAREEKAACLKVLAASRFSVLIGPAGTGKTTVLDLLCNHPDVKKAGVLLLAPTGKARVQLQQKTGVTAKTLAQFLLDTHRYDPAIGRYTFSELDAGDHGRTVVVDECSMLTEEQLASLLDALKGMDRLILVGDPRQLPPIGVGRPFVDIVRHLAPGNVETTFPRTAPGYAELTVRRRQGQTDKRPDALKEDLQLADWFGGRPLGPGEDEILARVFGGEDMGRLRFIEWKTEDDLRKTVLDVVVQELKLKGTTDSLGFDLVNGGVEFKGRAYFNGGRDGKPGAGVKAEAWQILSPVHGRTFGVTELNRIIQKQFRSATVEWAKTSPKYSTRSQITKPQGLEEICYGDKVINIENRRRTWIYPKTEDALLYVANGEIGIVVGQFRKTGDKWKVWKLQVEFSSQLGVAYDFGGGRDFNDEGSSVLELAYAVTVHKAQGSEFDLTILVLPNPCRLLSQELLYTALTRQRSRVVVLHQGDRAELRKYSSARFSATACRITDLFEAPSLRQVGDVFLEEGLIHVSRRGEPMRSKSEVIIANELDAAGIRYHYEEKFVGKDGQVRYPDFTIEDEDTGRRYIWEHCGMLTDDAYRKRWEAKKMWYRAQGVLPHKEGGGENGTLIETTDSAEGGISAAEIRTLVEMTLD